MTTYGDIWLLLTSVAFFANFWLLLCTLGYFWLLLAIFDYFWLLLATFGYFWLLARLPDVPVFGWLLRDGGRGPHRESVGTALPSEFTFPRLTLKQKMLRLGGAKININGIRKS